VIRPRTSWGPAAPRKPAAAALALTACAVLLAGCAAAPHRAAAPADGLPHTGVEVALGVCGKGWTSPHAGTQVFDIHNASDGPTEVDLVDPRTQQVYGEVEGIGPGTTRPLQVTVGGGPYAFKCLPDDADAMTGPTVTVPGRAKAGPATAAVSEQDVIPPTIAYQKWIGGRIATLATDVRTLRGDLHRGDLAAARRDWLTAHLVYETMGAAYDTFGDADGAINGTTAGLSGGVTDPGFTGFHRIEYGLWHGAGAHALAPWGDRLVRDVDALKASWPTARMDPLLMGLRAHEIIENAVQFELTGRTDYGSGSNLATADANLTGTEQVLDELRPLIRTRYPDLPQLDASLAHLRTVLDSHRHDGSWAPLSRLTTPQREALDAAAGDSVERLADIAAIFDIRRTS
jgi:iron uptake system component EfeO